MTKQDIRLIISDIDGTIPDDLYQVDPQLVEQISLKKKTSLFVQRLKCAIWSRFPLICARSQECSVEIPFQL